MKIESEKAIVNASQRDVYIFLIDARNIEKLLPTKEVKDFKATKTECSFKVQGGVTISLIQEELLPNNTIKMKSGEKSPFPFELTVYLNEEGESTVGNIIFDGKVNAFLQTMVKKPLNNLFNYMIKSLKNNFEG